MGEIKSFYGRAYLIAKVCAYCSRRLSLFGGRIDSKVKDYIVPLSRGGEEISENIVASCKECQALKGEYLNFALLPLLRHRPELIDDIRHYLKEVRQVMGVRSSVMDLPG